MDDHLCDPSLLSNTYKQFSKVNGLLSRWRMLYLTQIRPVIRNIDQPTLLDIGFGGGDVVLDLRKWALNDGIDLKITAVDSDPRALSFVKSHTLDKFQGLAFRHCSVDDLIVEGKKFDVVISNHVLHHLLNDEIADFLENSKSVAKNLVLHNDIKRNMLAYYCFHISKIIFKKSFIVEDGLVSIRRSFTAAELKRICGKDWEVKEYPFFRIVVSFRW